MTTNAFITGKVSVPSGSAVLIVAARPGRSKVRIVGAVYLGADNSVTPSNGFAVTNEFGNPIMDLETDAALYGIAASSGAVDVSFIELFNT